MSRHQRSAAAARLAADGFAGLTSAIEDTHEAIARRVYRPLAVAGAPSRLLHQAISRTVFAGVRTGGRLAGAAGAVAAAALADDPPVPVVGAVNGAWGDRLARAGNPLALDMTAHYDRAAATGDVVVFVHGLCETERSWRVGAAKHWGDPASTHGSRLAAARGCTPVYLRYNSGLHISDNGGALATLLTDLVAGWPVEVTRLTLVGHSMGGLVLRTACHLGAQQRAPWLAALDTCVYLGAPHLGAPLEVAATAAGIALRALPETRGFGRALASRSAGIKDLRFGDVLVTDWEPHDPDRWRPEPDAVTPLADAVDHYYIGTTLGRRHDTVAARVLGDLLVPFASASGNGRRRRLGFELDKGAHLGRLHHFDLLNHPRVYAQLAAWLAPPSTPARTAS